MISSRKTALGAAMALLAAACGADETGASVPVDGDEPFIAPEGEIESIDGALTEGPPAPEMDEAVRAAEVENDREEEETLPPGRGGESIDVAEDNRRRDAPEDVEATIAFQSGLNEVKPAPATRYDSPVAAFIEEDTAEAPDIARAMALGPRAFDQARLALENASDRDSQGRAAILLGFSGREEASAILREYIISGPARTLSDDWYNAKRDAIFALGYLANVSEGAYGIDFLLAAARPEYWAEQDIAWQSPFFATQAERDKGLAQLSLLGLVLSGRPEAEAEFQRLVDPRRNDVSNAPFSPEEARGLMAEWRKVRAMGIASYSAQGL